MRYHEIIAEMAVPSEMMRSWTYYHGTSHDDRGRSILASGLRPGNTTTNARGHLTPVVGRAYLTSQLRYGIIYCIGGAMLGCSEDSVKWLVEKAGQFGWLFVFAGKNIANDVQPDEDSVGEAVMYAHRILNNLDVQFYQDDPLYQGLLNADRGWLRAFAYNAAQAMTKQQFKGVVDGFIAAQAAGGKRFLKTMLDRDKTMLIQCGAHVAHEGNLQPDQAWRFDKTQSPQLAKDGSNFFDLAQRVH